MLDSTHPNFTSPADASPPRRRRRALDPCSPEALAALVQLVEEELPVLVGTLLCDSSLVDGTEDHGSGDGTHVDPRLVQLVEETGNAIVALGRAGRLPRRRDLIPFRLLGAECAHAGISADDMTETLDGAAEAIRDLAVEHSHGLDCRFGAVEVDRAVAAFSGGIETFSRFAYDELLFGHTVATRSAIRPPVEHVALIRRALDGDGTDLGLDAQAAAAGFDTATTHALVLLVGHDDDAPERITAAARDLGLRLPRLIHAGPAGVPLHHRVIAERVTREAWGDSVDVFHDTAVRHRILALLFPPVASLRALREVYAQARDDLAGAVAAFAPQCGAVFMIDPTGSHSLIPPPSPPPTEPGAQLAATA